MDFNIDSTELNGYINNYKTNDPLPETKSIAIELEHLQTFINQARAAGCNAVKIHLIRYPLTENQPHILKMDGKNFSQVSLALTGATIDDAFPIWKVSNKSVNGDEFLTLLVCKPVTAATTTRTTDDKTGICKPNCGRGDAG